MLIKHSLLYPIKRVFYLWASYAGNSIVREPAVASLFSNSIYKATHQQMSYGKNISSVFKVLSQECFSMTFYCNYVVKRVWKKLLAQPHSSPLCFTLIHNASLFLTEFFRNVTNSVVTPCRKCLRISRNQKTNWIGGNGFDVEESVKTQIRQMLQKK